MTFHPDIKRPTWDEQHMMAALLPAARSSCLVRAVGAALVRDNRVIASGYNGAPSGLESCIDLGYCYYQDLAWQHIARDGGEFTKVKELYKQYCIASHAEVNTLNQCSIMGHSPEGAILYVSTFPCPKCTRDEIVGKKLGAVKVLKPYLADETAVTDDRREAVRILDQAKVPYSFVDLSDGRINEITTLMQLVGGRTQYQSTPRNQSAA